MKKRARRTARLEATLGSLATPLFLLDAKRRIVFFNAGLEQLSGWTADEVAGRVCDYASEADPGKVESLTSALCPPPAVFNGEQVSAPVFLTSRNGKLHSRILNFFPLTDQQGELQAILGICSKLSQEPRTATVNPSQELHAELAALRISLRQRFSTTSFIGRSKAMLRVLAQTEIAKTSRSPVCLIGETGTGKEHVARLIHYESELHSRPFVPLDCRGLPFRQLKSALRRLLEATHDTSDESTTTSQPGTLYLSNVDGLPHDLQQLLVAAFQDESANSTNGLRLMASSTTALESAVDSDTLREDLFYLLTTIKIDLPRLRDRREDLQPLAQFFLEERNRGEEKQVGGFSDEVWEQFQEYNWPGNLDELMAVVTEAWSTCSGGIVQVGDLPFRFRTGLDGQHIGPPIDADITPLASLLATVEAEEIRRVLTVARQNKTRAAKLLGLTRARLYRRMQALDIADQEEKA